VIKSPKNPTIQHIRRLQSRPKSRREAGQFVLEGRRLVADALDAGRVPDEVLYSSAAESEVFDLLERCRALTKGTGQRLIPTPVSEAAMQAASDTQTPQGILAVLQIASLPLPQQPTFLLILDAVRDPGNLGAILRTAAAAGVEGVLLGPGCADPFSPKVVRAGMGAHFRLAVHSLPWEAISAASGGLQLFLADAGASLAYTAGDFRPPCALIIGGEAHGPGAAAKKLPATGLHIPMPGKMESLNAAMAAGILIYEVLRQRRG
jgi:TrmH family RNA methyltransferase